VTASRIHVALIGTIATIVLGYTCWTWNEPYAAFFDAFLVVQTVIYAIASTIGYALLPRRPLVVIALHAGVLAVVFIRIF
jgi:hypothetical protein